MNPISIKAAAIAAVIALVIMSALLTWGLYWRGEYREAKAQVTVYADQANINKAAVDACSTATDQAARVGDAAIAAMGPLVDAAKAGNKDRARVAASLEELAGRKRQPGEDCSWAWRLIEEEHRKARAAP